ncbi:MAG: hypothetical protein JST00_06525 [Deltaproteobacteria bacterium]|nr:hypothetical protein [Deltaproteobacteria bacterium]
MISRSELVGIALFALNYAVVVPASVIACLLAFVLRKRSSLRWMIAVGAANVVVAGGQVATFGSDMERWLLALLCLQAAAGIAVVVGIALRQRVGG